jgi:hypothetical protein
MDIKEAILYMDCLTYVRGSVEDCEAWKILKAVALDAITNKAIVPCGESPAPGVMPK